MLGYFRLKKLRAELTDPTEAQLSFNVDCFTAGFARAIKDTRNDVPFRDWVELVSHTSMRLANDHSPATAGSWLAGVINGRIAAAENFYERSTEQKFNEQIRQAFDIALKSGHILECAEHTIAPFMRKSRGPASMLLKLGESVLPG